MFTMDVNQQYIETVVVNELSVFKPLKFNYMKCWHFYDLGDDSKQNKKHLKTLFFICMVLL